MEHRHARLKAFADLMEREYWIHAVPPKRCASVAEPPGGSKGEPVDRYTTVPVKAIEGLCCRFFRCQQIASARVMQGACLVLRSCI